MPDDAPPHGGIDWKTASVDDATLTVEITGKPGRTWTARVQEIFERLDRAGSPWGAIKVKKGTLRVEDVTPGSEADLRHLVESAVLQANAEFAPDDEDDDGDDDDRSAEDQDMTERFRAFSEDDDESEDEDDDEDEDAPDA